MSLWSKFMDVVTITWIASVFVSFMPEYHHFMEQLVVFLLIFFAADFLILYFNSKGIKDFIRNEWFGILMVFPWFRVFRIVGLLKVLGITKIAKGSKALKVFESSTYSKGKEFGEMGRQVKKRTKKN